MPTSEAPSLAVRPAEPGALFPERATPAILNTACYRISKDVGIEKQFMKTIVLLILLGCFVSAMPVTVYASAGTHSQDRSARKGLKQQAKAQKKYAKARRKAERKMLKTERKNTKLPPRRF